MPVDINEIMTQLGEYISLYGLRILGAIAIFFIGRWVVNLGVKFVLRLMEKAKLDAILCSFAGNILRIVGLSVVILAVLGQVGVQTASLVAILGAAGLAVGLALQGSLSNLAAGVMIIFFKPFRLGDYIEAAGTNGTVKALNIFTTTLLTLDNKTVIVPNGSITSNNITNYSAQPTRRIDLVFGIGYGDDLKKAKNILQQLIDQDDRILEDPAPQVVVLELADNSVNFAVRPWVKKEDFWNVRCDLIEQVKLTFDQENISIPFPQRDMHLHLDDDVLDQLNKKKAA